MVDILNDRAFAAVSAQVSAGDGIVVDTMTFQPPASAASFMMQTTAELWRRAFTKVLSPSATLVSGGSAGSVALNFGATPLGLWVMCQGQPAIISGTGTLSGSPTSNQGNTLSYQIRKILVTLPFPAFGASGPAGSSLGSTAITALQFVYGSAMNTSALACTSGGQGASYFDMVPLPLASANEVPVGWINVFNSASMSALGLVASCLYSDLRILQGMNLSNILGTRIQP